MPKTRKQRKADKEPNIPLAHPDRSAPSEQTLLQIADSKNLFQAASRRQAELDKAKSKPSTASSSSKSNGGNEDDESESASQDEENLLSPGQERFLEACLWTATLAMVHFTFDVFVHNQYAKRIEWGNICFNTIRAWVAGCALIYVTNSKGYMYNMSRAPPLACLWLWAVVELDLPWAVGSLAVAVGYLLKNGYSIK